MGYLIVNTISGVSLGVYHGDNERGALDSLARDAGYDDYEALCRAVPVQDGELSVKVYAQ